MSCTKTFANGLTSRILEVETFCRLEVDGHDIMALAGKETILAIQERVGEIPSFPEDDPSLKPVLARIDNLRKAQEHRNACMDLWWRAACAEAEGFRRHSDSLMGKLREAQNDVQSILLTLRPQDTSPEEEKALRMIREETDGACDDAGLVEAVAVLISQRDNARNEAKYYSSELRAQQKQRLFPEGMRT